MLKHHQQKKRYTSSKRKKISCKLKKSNPNRIPVIIEHSITGKVARFLIPDNAQLSMLLFHARKTLCGNIEIQKAIWILTANEEIIPCTNSIVGDLYDTHGDQDGFLYLWLSEENAFGKMHYFIFGK
jgi:hypothetical protein